MDAGDEAAFMWTSVLTEGDWWPQELCITDGGGGGLQVSVWGGGGCFAGPAAKYRATWPLVKVV